jgi:sterol desaturase/sphingolipid hydroxylase (fatty acid hydroxylase superfamily)
MLIAIIVISVALVMFGIERVRPARNWPPVKGWWWRAIALNLIQVSSVLLTGYVFDPFILRFRLWSAADSLGVTGGAIIGYLVLTFVYYWWHRWRHEVDFLWRWLHQLHHSPQRIEIITSFYKHPLEIISNSIISSAILYLVVGVGPAAAAQATMLTGLAELIYHWNVRTPYWMGYIFQRPESHCVHHQAGHHTQNFSDLPIWDIIFGTFNNPKNWDGRCGFGELEHQVGTMLRGHDVSHEPVPRVQA